MFDITKDEWIVEEPLNNEMWMKLSTLCKFAGLRVWSGAEVAVGNSLQRYSYMGTNCEGMPATVGRYSKEGYSRKKTMITIKQLEAYLNEAIKNQVKQREALCTAANNS